MLEILLGSGVSGKFFPDSGPGSKYLVAGDKTYGYFGTVTETEMSLNPEFKRLLYNTTATVITVDVMQNEWFKFVINGKFLFFPRLPLAGKIDIADLYAMKAVYDANEQFKPTLNPITGLALYTQNTHVSNGIDLFLVRLMDAIPANYLDAGGAVYPYNGSGEVWQLIAALCKGTATYSDILGIRTYSQVSFSTLYDGLSYPNTYVKEYYKSSSVFQYNYRAGANDVYPIISTTLQAWRPVLQYIPNDQRATLLFDLDSFNVTNEGLPYSAIVSYSSEPALYSLTSFTNITEAYTLGLSTSPNSIYQIQPLGGFQTIDNTVPVSYLSFDTSMELYDTVGLAVIDYSGYISITTDIDRLFTYSSGLAPIDYSGYMTAV